jgi:hypothetical protein
MYRLSEQYGLARITGIPAKSGDSGGLSNAVATLIKSFGVCSSRYLPYPDDNFFAQATKEEINALLNAAPTSVQLEMAKKQLQEFEYYSVLQTIDNLSRKVSLSVVDPCDNFKEIKSSINPIDFFKWSIEELDLPVCIGIPIFSNWGLTDASQFGIIDMPAANDTIEGGHAVLAVGYNDDYVFPSGAKGAIIFQNSWGEAWPAHNVYGSCAGLGLLPYDLFDRYSLGISYGPIVTKCSMIDTVEGHFLGELIAN